MPPVGFESTIAAGERPQTYTLDGVTWTGMYTNSYTIFVLNSNWRPIFRTVTGTQVRECLYSQQNIIFTLLFPSSFFLHPRTAPKYS